MLLYFPNFVSLFLINISKGDTGADPLPCVTLITPSKLIQEGHSG